MESLVSKIPHPYTHTCNLLVTEDSRHLLSSNGPWNYQRDYEPQTRPRANDGRPDDKHANHSLTPRGCAPRKPEEPLGRLAAAWSHPCRSYPSAREGTANRSSYSLSEKKKKQLTSRPLSSVGRILQFPPHTQIHAGHQLGLAVSLAWPVTVKLSLSGRTVGRLAQATNWLSISPTRLFTPAVKIARPSATAAWRRQYP